MGIGLLELVVIAVVALVLLGPQRLPEVLRQLGKFYVQLRRTSSEFRGVVDQVVRQAEMDVRLDEIKRLTKLAQESEDQAVAAEALPPSNHPSNPPPIGRSESSLAVFDQNHESATTAADIKDPHV